MKKEFRKLSFLLVFVFFLGSFSFAQDKKDPAPVPASPQQECTENNGNIPNPKTTPETKPYNSDSLLTPPLIIPEGFPKKV